MLRRACWLSPTRTALRRAKGATEEAHAAPIPRHLQQQWNSTKNKLLRPQHTPSNSVRVAWWTCGSCGDTFKKRVKDHVESHGRCPGCQKVPSPKGGKQKAAPAVPTAPSVTPAATPKAQGYLKDARILQPMLAYPYDKYKHRIAETEDLFTSPKLDGVRVVVAYNGKAKRPYFFSRHGGQFDSCDHIVPALMPWFERDPQLVLDGELYNHKFRDNFSAVISAVKTTKEHRTAEKLALQQELQLHIFDVMYTSKWSGATTPFPNRWLTLSGLFRQWETKWRKALPPNERNVLQLVPQQSGDKGDIAARMEAVLGDGYEGLMVRTTGNTYHFGKRTPTLLKHKIMEDAEFKIVAVVEGQGRLAGMMGAVTCVTKDGKEFNASFAIPDAGRKRAWELRNSFVGQMATVHYQELSPNGVPRFAVFKAIRGKNKKDFV